MTANPSGLSAWERLEQGRQVKASNGGYAGYGSPAFGQRAVNGELVDDPAEHQVIELIRRHHKSGKSLQKIADWLNEQGYMTKRRQPWQRISVKRVLDRLYGKRSRISGVAFQKEQNLAVHTSNARDTPPNTIEAQEPSKKKNTDLKP
jgi:Recombinase